MLKASSEKQLQLANIGLLKDSEKRYRRLFESAKDGILILDANTGKVVDANPFLLDLINYSYDELWGKHIWEIGTFKDIAASKDAFKTLQDNEYIRYKDLPLETRKGKSIEVEFVSNVYMVDHSKVIQCNIRDNTAHKQTEKALEISESKLRSILDNIGIGVSLISPKMEIIELNRRMHEWFPSVDLGQHQICYHAFNNPPRDEPCDDCPTQKTLQDGLVHEGTTQTPGLNGIRNYRIVSSPVLNASGKVTAAIEMVEDITEKLLMETQVQQTQKMEAIGLMAGGVAHDYNNMLSIILGYTEMALKNTDLDESLRANLKEILKATKRSIGITQQMLAFSRKQVIIPVLLDLNQRVKSMLNMLSKLIGASINLVWQPGKELWLVKMDSIQVDQILVNLCANAKDAINDCGKITITTENVVFDEAYCVKHIDFATGEYVQLTVSDDGCGMDEKILDKIFEPFFTSKEVGQGTGLGLSTVYGIVKQNNGQINVFSKPEKGTTFKIFLPRQHADQTTETKKEMEKFPLGHDKTVLLVEDEIALLTMGKMMLEKLGYRVLTAEKPDEAIRMAEEHAKEIDLLITDVIMPQMNGWNLAKQLHTLYPNMKILFMSGYTADVIASHGVDNGANFIRKPFSIKELAVKVQDVLNAKLVKQGRNI
jgi:PAS domain S-box-containing protein